MTSIYEKFRAFLREVSEIRVMKITPVGLNRETMIQILPESKRPKWCTYKETCTPIKQPLLQTPEDEKEGYGSICFGYCKDSKQVNNVFHENDINQCYNIVGRDKIDAFHKNYDDLCFELFTLRWLLKMLNPDYNEKDNIETLRTRAGRAYRIPLSEITS